MKIIAESLQSFTPVEVYLSSDFETDADSYHYFLENLHPLLSSFNATNEEICVRIYHNERQIPNFSYQMDHNLDELLKQHPETLLGDAGVWIHDRMRLNTFETMYSYYRCVRETNWPNRILAIIAVHADEAMLYNQIANEPVESRTVFVMDKKGNILTSNRRDAIGRSVEEYPTSDGRLLMEIPDGARVEVEKEAYILLRRETEQLDIAYLLSYESIHAAQRMSLVILVIVGGILMVLASVLILYTSKGITEGINSLKKKMLNIDRESIRTIASLHLQEKTEDEVAQLENVFTDMMGQIDTLMDRIQLQERRLKDEVITRQQAEIMALQRQIDPHYLFNTLESIRMKLLIKDDREDAEIVKLFAITAVDVEDCNVVLTYNTTMYSGTYKTPDVVVEDPNGEELIAGTDYEVAYANNKNAGTATVTVTGIGNYTGVVSRNFTIKHADLTQCTVTVNKLSIRETGDPLEPGVVVKTAKGTKLVEGLNYTVAYTNNVEPGTATVTVSGIGNYTGTLSAEFTITARRDIAEENFTATLKYTIMNYTGAERTPAVSLKTPSGTVLKNGTNYTVTYSDNVEVGTATVTITGIGKYKGTITLTFKIRPQKVTTLNVVSSTANSITVNFQTVESADKYYIYVNGEYYACTKTKTTYKIKGLESGKTYTIYIKAVAEVDGKNYYSSVGNKVTATTK